jgi:hypothetical protein
VQLYYNKLLTAAVIGGCIGGGVGINGDIAGAIIDYFISISFIYKNMIRRYIFQDI